jgi:[FeFe] hydrogenase H-cluster maturation GTPase HydF
MQSDTAMKTQRTFIGIFGRSNNGKSSLVNAITNQDIAIVSDKAGTTTDPVKKSMEIFGIGPVVWIDTAGIDDTSDLSRQRLAKTYQTLQSVDAAMLVIANNQFDRHERNLIRKAKEYEIPFLIVHNKSDMRPLDPQLRVKLSAWGQPVIETNALTGYGVDSLIKALVQIIPATVYTERTLIGDLIKENDFIALVMPQDSEAPQGRLILPQQQLIRDILDHHAVAVGMQPQQLPHYLAQQIPRLVITDSQAFKEVSAMVPSHISMTSFSIILARAKGNFDHYLKGTPFLDRLQNGDKILTLESCTHPVSCEDIGKHKLPHLIRQYTGKELVFEMVSSLSPLPSRLTDYAMAIQCGACMVSTKQIQLRVNELVKRNIPVSNYGMTLAYVNGIFERAVKMFVSEGM